MKFMTIFAALFALALTGCNVVAPEPGKEAVLVDQPWVFGEGGVRNDTVKGGTREYTWLSTKDIAVIVTPQQRQINFDDFASKDNILLDFSASIQYRITNPPVMVKEFGDNWFENNLAAQFTAIVRDQVKANSMTDLMSNPATAKNVDDKVTDAVNALVKENKIPIQVINVTLGRARPNENVLAQMNDTAAQQQRVKTLTAAVLAEEERKKEQEAKADADNAYRAKMGLTPEQYLVREIAEINATACREAKGGCTVVPTGSTLTLGR